MNPQDTYLRQQTEAGTIGAADHGWPDPPPTPAQQEDGAKLRFIPDGDDMVPDQVFDRVVVEYAETAHDGGPREPQDAADGWCLDRAKRFLLVERSTRSGRHHLSSHAGSLAAGDYYLTQDCREDWTIVELVDHVGGHRYTANIRVLWNPIQPGPDTQPAS